MRTGVLALVALCAFSYYQYTQHRSARVERASVAPAASAAPAADAVAAPTSAPSFACDGRRFCSEMRSCDEAKFFLKNCPGTQMDGDRDGVPCEQQWCRGG